MGEICHGFGALYLATNRPDEALPLVERACRLHKRCAAAPDSSAWPRLRLGQSYYKLAQVQRELDRASEARRSCRQACEVLERLLDETECRQQAAHTLVNAARDLIADSRHKGSPLELQEELQESCRLALRVFARLAKEDPGDAELRGSWALHEYRLAQSYRTDVGDAAQAEVHYTQARRLWEQLTQDQPQRTDFISRLVKLELHSAKLQHEQQRYEPMLRHLDRAIDLCRTGRDDSPEWRKDVRSVGRVCKQLLVKAPSATRSLDDPTAWKQTRQRWEQFTKAVESH